MTGLQSFHDWQDAEHQADTAQHACSTAIRAGQRPTTQQLDDVARLRAAASDKLRAMMAFMKNSAEADRVRPIGP